MITYITTGLWFSYDDVNGTKFWENDPSYTKPHIGRIVVRNAQYQEGDRSGTLTATMEWRDPSGKTLLVEDRKMIFHSDPKRRSIEFEIPSHRGGRCHLRRYQGRCVRDPSGGQLHGEERRQGWVSGCGWPGHHGQHLGQALQFKVDYTAEVEGERLGVAIFDHPQNPRHPTYWHARDYGLFALNPFGRNAFDSTQEESQWKVPAGQKLLFRWNVLIHPGDAETGHVADLYKQYAAGH